MFRDPEHKITAITTPLDHHDSLANTLRDGSHELWGPKNQISIIVLNRDIECGPGKSIVHMPAQIPQITTGEEVGFLTNTMCTPSWISGGIGSTVVVQMISTSDINTGTILSGGGGTFPARALFSAPSKSLELCGEKASTVDDGARPIECPSQCTALTTSCVSDEKDKHQSGRHLYNVHAEL
ncbi:hypothetical protein C8F04DRAFT_1189615 [Mycena alexandri]|uniref:Uncharacterized protein n=1 Tax=Mycena alexandri TaxID=1745969 RepID=A0AAD6SI10_9AGAR|nr:hypothetical protein C8F04DRAFT_1189615 [Mycena alexandri]